MLTDDSTGREVLGSKAPVLRFASATKDAPSYSCVGSLCVLRQGLRLTWQPQERMLIPHDRPGTPFFFRLWCSRIRHHSQFCTLNADVPWDRGPIPVVGPCELTSTLVLRTPIVHLRGTPLGAATNFFNVKLQPSSHAVGPRTGRGL